MGFGVYLTMNTKHIFLSSFLTLALCGLGVSTSSAQSTNPASTPAPAQGSNSQSASHGFRKGPPAGVSKEDWEKFKQTRKEVINSTPALKTQADAFKAERKEAKTEGQKPSFGKGQRKAFEEQVKAAVLAKDPSLASVYVALEKAHAEHKAQKGTATPATQS